VTALCRGSELPQQILPTAQRLLDELLSGAQSLEINTVSGAPDPTAGGSVGEQSAWCLDSKNLRDNIKKILIKVYRGPLITVLPTGRLFGRITQKGAE
jgi:hypothetical protein